MLKPLNDRILVKVKVQEEALTASGILLAKGSKITADGKLEDETEENADSGVVICGGSLVKKGDTVWFSRYGSDKITYDLTAEPVYAISEASLIAVLEG